MDKIIKNILKKIENEGYEAYIVGGFVRDLLMHNASFDVDICTNALPKDLKNIFPKSNNANSYGGFNIKLKKYNVDITTYRREKKYDKRKPVEVEYINNLFEDIKRRDFTINALCMDKNDNIIDLLHSTEDLNNKIIRSIGDANEKFNQDPLRMLRAIRFASILNFKIEKETYKAIENNANLVSSLSSERIKEELTKILSNEGFLYGLSLLEQTKIAQVIGLNYKDINFTADILGMWAQIDCEKITFSKTEKDNIAKIRQILNIKKIGNNELFNYGLYLCLVAGDILGYTHQTINRMYKNLPIYSMKDIDINGKEIINLLKTEPGKIISDIMLDIKHQILNGKLKNKKSEIKKYIMEKYNE